MQTLLGTTQGKEILETELRPILEDPKICKVGVGKSLDVMPYTKLPTMLVEWHGAVR